MVASALRTGDRVRTGARIGRIGAALIPANALAIITDVFPVGKRGTAMGVQAILISGGASMGPIIGGFLVTRFGWQSVFLVNVPIGIIAAIMATLILPPLKSNRTMEPIDWVGSGLLLGGLAEDGRFGLAFLLIGAVAVPLGVAGSLGRARWETAR